MTPYEKDRQSNRIAWLVFTTLVMIGLIAAVRSWHADFSAVVAPLPPPAALSSPETTPSGDQDEPSFVQQATNSNLGDLDVPGQYADRYKANHQEDGK